MSESSRQEESLSETQDVIISEDYPAVEASAESSALNRLGKMVQKVGQNQWISEIDLFSIPMKLNIGGEESLKTEFGGLMLILTAFISIFFTVVNQFPDGLVLEKPITYYSTNQALPSTVHFFDHTETFLELFLFNIDQLREANQTQIAFMVKGVSAMSVTNGIATKLSISRTGCPGGGFACFKKQNGNSLDFLSGTQTSSGYTTLNIQVSSCSFFQTGPIGACMDISNKYSVRAAVRDFNPTTGALLESFQDFLILPFSYQAIKLDTVVFTTNNDFFGHLANILPQQLTFYRPATIPAIDIINFKDAGLNCFSFFNVMGNMCTGLELRWSGTSQIYTENFDDITAPILFFLSLMQTVYYIIYILFIRNYANNVLFLKIADSVVFIEDSNGKHYKFKSGPSVFFACLVHNNKITQAIDYVLYRCCQTHIKRYLPLKAQLTIKMIDYGERCLGEEMVFDQMGRACQQENLQPTKIIFDDNDEEESELSQKDKILKEEVDEDQQRPYFDNEIDQEAFRRMCKDHDFYSAARKRHLSILLKSKEKTYKLVLQAQSQFEKYRWQVKSEYGTKEVELPIGFAGEDYSAVYLRKSNA